MEIKPIFVVVAPEFIAAHWSEVKLELFSSYSNTHEAGFVLVVYLYLSYSVFPAVSVLVTKA